jgi:[acyl-carrier-protein] S-malonyltransferase
MVHARGRYMQEAVADGHGAMAAVLGASEADVSEACRLAAAQTRRVVTPANYNSPGQTVIAGDAAAVELACAMARERGAKRTIPLAVSAPFHCELMAPAAEKLALELARVRFADARPPVVTNVEAEPNSDGARIPGLLRKQVTAPVRFVEMVQRMRALGVTQLLEIGPGRVLGGLVARIDRRLLRANLSVLGDLPAALRFLSARAA